MCELDIDDDPKNEIMILIQFRAPSIETLVATDLQPQYAGTFGVGGLRGAWTGRHHK